MSDIVFATGGTTGNARIVEKMLDLYTIAARPKILPYTVLFGAFRG